MSKFFRWLFWNMVYSCQPQTKRLDRYITRALRRQWPWRTFRSCVCRNDDGCMWVVYLAVDRSYTVPRKHLLVDVHVSDNGKVIGFDVWDESLRKLEAEVIEETRELGRRISGE